MASVLPKLLSFFNQQGLSIQVGGSETRTQDPDAQFARAFHADGSPLSTGAGIAQGEVLFLEGLLESAAGNVLVVGNGFGWCAVALGLIVQGRGKVLTMDACLEGSEGSLGLDLVRRAAADLGLPLKAEVGYSPTDVPGLVRDHLEGRLDFVLVDSLHTDEQQIRDYQAIRPHLHPGSVVVFHDVLNWRTEESFRAIAAEDGRKAAILYRTASGMGILYPEGHPAQAWIEAHQGTALPPRAPGSIWEDRYAYLASLYASQGDGAAFEKYIQKALAETSVPERVWMTATMIFFDRMDWEACERCLAQVEALRPGWSEPGHFRGLIAQRQGAPAERVWDLLSRAAAQEGVTAELQADVAMAAMATGRLREALGAAVQAAKERPGWGLPSHLAGLAARQMGEPPRRVWELFQPALDAGNASPEHQIDAGFAAYDAGLPAEAERLARAVASSRPTWSLPWHLLAMASRRLGRTPAEVWGVLQEALRREPVSRELLYDAAQCAWGLGNEGAARDLAGRCLALDPAWGDAQRLAARLGLAGKPEAARDVLP